MQNNGNIKYGLSVKYNFEHILGCQFYSLDNLRKQINNDASFGE